MDLDCKKETICPKCGAGVVASVRITDENYSYPVILGDQIFNQYEFRNEFGFCPANGGVEDDWMVTTWCICTKCHYRWFPDPEPE